MKKTEKHALTVRIALLVMLDILFMQVASFASLWIRHEFDFQAVEETFIHTVWRYMPLNILVTLAVFSMFHLYTSLWKYASITELSCIVAAVAISSLLHVLGMAVMGLKMFKSYLLLYFLLFLFMVVGLRFSYRFFRFVRNKCNRGMVEKRENVMIIGAGDAGAAIIKENRLSKAATRKVCCLIDKDPKKWGRYILGCPVVGGADKIMESVEKYKIQKIVIAIPSATSQQIKELVEICKETKCELKILPGIYQLIDGEVSISQLREVEIEDLLGREPVKVDLEEILGYIQGKTVLVTGGGGSIGSEICRQLAGHGVGKLIIFDVYENNAYAIQQELKRKYPNLDLEVLIKLSGYEPDVDIKIEFTGLRPGEKLYEELLMDEEGMQTTENKRIFIGRQIDVDEETFEKNIEALDEASRREDKNIRELVHKIVPEYRYQASQK